MWKENINTPIISVLIPVYNVEKYLPQCINSVLNQTCKQLEVILIDDGSTDNCPAICDGYAEKNTCVKVIHKENGGLSDARNIGIAEARGEYILLLDGDDYLASCEVLERLCEQIKNSALKIYFTPYVVTSENLHAKSSSWNLKTVKRNKMMWNIIYKKYRYFTAWTWICNRNFITENKLLFYKGILHEDEEWLVRLICAIGKKDKIGIIHFPLYFYRLNREGAITQQIKEKNIIDRLFIIDLILNFARRKSKFEKRFLLTRAAQIMTFVIKNGKQFYLLDRELCKIIQIKSSVLKKSILFKHKLIYLYLRIFNREKF